MSASGRVLVRSCTCPALFALLCPALFALPCSCPAPALHCPALPCPALPCPAPPHPALPLPLPTHLLHHQQAQFLTSYIALQIFVLVTFATVTGKLRPGIPGIKLKQSSEAAGSNNFPLLAYINIITVVAATVLYSILFIPAVGLQELVYNYVMCGSQIVFIWFCNWVRSITDWYYNPCCMCGGLLFDARP